MAIAHSSSTTSQNPNNLTNTSLSVTGLSTSSSNLNVVHISGVASGTDINPTMTTPSGWTKLGEALDSSGSAMTWVGVYWKFGNGATSQTFSWTNAGQMIAVATVYSGVDSTTPIPSYQIEAKGTTNTSYTVSVTTAQTGWIVSGFANRSGHTFSALADTSRGTVTLSASAAMTVQDSAADVTSGTITRTATGSGSTSVGAEWILLLKPSSGAGVSHTLTLTDDIGMAETGANLLAVVETITNPVGVTDTMVRTYTPGAVTPPPTTAADFTALVEIAFDDTPRSSAPTYTDVAPYVRVASTPSMSRGRSNEFDPQAQAGRASVEFVNDDDRFTVGNDSSPYAPLQIRRPIRFRLAYGGNVYPVWQGFIDSWDNGRDETTGIAQVDASDRLARAASVRLKGLVSAEILADTPSAYYPLGDDGDSLTAGDQSTVLGNPPLTIAEYGTITDAACDFGTAVAPGPDGGTVITLTPDDVDNGKYLTASSPSGWGFVSGEDGYTVELFIKTSIASRGVLRLGSGSNSLRLDLTFGGYVEAFYGTASVTGTLSSALTDFEWHHIAAAVYRTSATDVYLSLWVDGVHQGTPSGTGELTRRDRLDVGFDGDDVGEGQFAHVAIYPTVLTTDRIAAHASAGLGGHAGDTSTDRFQRLCSAAGLPAGMYDVDGTGLSIMSAQPTAGVGLLDLIRQCADAEAGVTYVRSSGQLAMAPRSARFGADVGLTLDARTQLGTAFTLATDDGLLVNDVTASRPGGATIRVTDDDSVAAYDTHDDTVTLYVNTDEQVTSLAEWRVFTASQPSPRCTSITVDAVAYEASGGDVVELLEADMGTRVSITNLPSDTSADSTLDLFIEGVSVRLEKHGPVFTFTTSPVGASGSVWIIEDPVYGLTETGGVIAP